MSYGEDGQKSDKISETIYLNGHFGPTSTIL